MGLKRFLPHACVVGSCTCPQLLLALPGPTSHAGVRVAVRGGLTLREAIHIMEKVHETGRLAAVDLVEVNPNLGSARDVQTTVEAALQVLLAAFGHSRLGNMPRTAEIPLTKGATLKKDA